MSGGVFVSGTDTNIGKTVTSALLVSALLSSGRKAGYFKPAQTGEDSDTQTVIGLSGLGEEGLIQPVYRFPEPMAPSRAARIRGAEIRLERIREEWEKRSDRSWVVEGAGGLWVPLNREHTMHDLIGCLELPLLLVSSTRLGTINHTLLTLESARAAKIPVAGLVLVGERDEGLIECLRDFDEAPVLAQIPRLPEVTRGSVGEWAPRLFPEKTLSGIWGAHA